MTSNGRLVAGEGQAARLAALKTDNNHLWRSEGLMIDDAEAVAALTSLAARLGTSKRKALKQALQHDLDRIKDRV